MKEKLYSKSITQKLPTILKDVHKHAKKRSPIRTNDPEITNHVLWPTELKRRVGKLTISRRYNQLTFAAIKPWRIRKELAVWDLPVFQR